MTMPQPRNTHKRFANTWRKLEGKEPNHKD